MLLDILLTFFLVLLNGFFVAAKFAIVKVRSSQIAVQSISITKKAAVSIVGKLDGFLAATQLGITLASLGLGWIGEGVVSRIILNVMAAIGVTVDPVLAHKIAFPLAFLTITVLHIVFGELAPKSLALRYPLPTTMAVALPLRIFYFIFKPFIYVLNGFANFLLRMIGIQPVGEHEIHTEEELKLIIAESQEGGAIEVSERELIQNVFDFDNRLVRQIMVPYNKVSDMSVDLTIEEATKWTIKEGYSRYPVYEENSDNLIGVVHSKDIMAAYIVHQNKTLRDILRPVTYITEGKPIADLLREFQRNKVQLAVVVSEFGSILGIVSLEDILEELVGEIQDEYDHEPQIVTRIDDHTYHIIATSSIHDINKSLTVHIPESEEYETLAGMIVYDKEYDIKIGDTYSTGPFQLKVLKMNRGLPELVEATLRDSIEEGD